MATKIYDLQTATLKTECIDKLLDLFPFYEHKLEAIYNNNIRKKQKYFKDPALPSLIEHEILTNEQILAMVEFLEQKLFSKQRKENSERAANICFGLLVPHWAVSILSDKLWRDIPASETIEKNKKKTVVITVCLCLSESAGQRRYK